MSEQPSTPGSELTEQLSAYLDGELDAEARGDVEELLARDANARAELQRLERAWELLDGLPRIELEPSFTQTTVEMIAVRVADGVGETRIRTPRRRWAFLLVMGSLCLGAALAGFVAVKLAAPDPNAALINDLPVIENVEHYLQGGNVEFLRKLKQSGLFDRGGSNVVPAGPSIGYPIGAGESWADRRTRIERMSPAEKDQLLRQQQRFAQLDPAERDRLRAFAAELDRAPDGAELRQVLDHYYQWLLALPGIERAQLLQLEPEQRLDRIKQMKADQTRLAAHRLSPNDVQVVSNWLERRVMDNVQPQMRDYLQKLSPAERHRQIVGMMWQRSQSPEGFKGPGPLKPGDMQDLRGELSEAARKQLNQALDEHRVGQLMGDWVRQVLTGYFGAGRSMAAGHRGVSEEQLKRFFENELPEAERQQLLALPADELHNRLRRLYYLHKLGGPNVPNGGGTGQRRPMRGPGAPGESGRQPSPSPPRERNPSPRNPQVPAREGT